MMGRTGWTDEKVVERAEFVGRTVRELCQLLRAGGQYPEVSEQIARARGALESIRIAIWQRELTRTVSSRAGRVGQTVETALRGQPGEFSGGARGHVRGLRAG
jgi:hypothetical protein